MDAFIIFILGVLPPIMFFGGSALEPNTKGPSPLAIIGWAFFIGYTIQSLFLSYGAANGYNLYLSSFSSHNAVDVIQIGQAATVVGVFMFLIGYTSRFTFRLHANSGDKFPNSTQISPNILYYSIFAISFLLMAVYFVKMGFLSQVMNFSFISKKWYVDEITGVRNALGFLTVGGDVICIIVMYYFVLSKKLSLYNLYTVALLLVLLCYLLAGRRNGIMVFIMIFMISASARSININIFNKFRRYVIIIFVVIAIILVGQIRRGAEEKKVSDLDFGKAISITTEHVLKGAYFLNPNKTGMIIDQTSHRDLYLYGSSFVVFILAPIPRILWAEKPYIRVGPYVGQELLNFNNKSGAPPGGIGEFYMNFGWFGVIFGMLGLGVLTADGRRRYLRSEDMKFFRIRYALNIAAVVLFLLVDFSFAIIAFIQYRLAAYVCEAYWSSRYNRR